MGTETLPARAGGPRLLPDRDQPHGVHVYSDGDWKVRPPFDAQRLLAIVGEALG